MEYQTKYNSLLDLHKNLKEQFKTQMHGARVKVKELEAAIAAMSREADVTKEKMNDQQAAVRLNAEKLEKEKKLFTDLQNRMVQMEQNHIDELEELKAKHSTQLAEGSRKMETTVRLPVGPYTNARVCSIKGREGERSGCGGVDEYHASSPDATPNQRRRYNRIDRTPSFPWQSVGTGDNR